MSIIKGLTNLNKKMEERKGGKATWLKLEDKESVKLRFLNELDADSSSYNPDFGVAIGVAEHTNPKNFRRKAVCTRDEGGCVGCEMAVAHPKTGWASKIKLYTNVLVTPKKGDKEPYIAIWSIPVNDKSTVLATLKTVFEERGGISALEWSLGRSGTEFNNTVYTLLPGQDDKKPFVLPDGMELYNLEEVAIRSIAYEDQQKFYFGDDGDDDDEPKPAKDKDLTTEW